MEIRYEDLILDTEPVLRRVCEFIELPWDDALLTYHERSADRLKEMARALPAEGRAKELSVERRMATHEMTTKPPSADRVARWRTQMTAEQRARVRGDRRRPARPARLPDRPRRGRAGHRADRSRVPSDAHRHRQQVVCLRAGRRHEADPLGARRARPRDLRPRQAGQGAARADQERVADPVWDQPGVTQCARGRHPGRRVPRLGLGELARGRAHRPERPVRRDRRAARATACGRSAASSGRASPPRTPSRRRTPTTSSTRSPAPSRSATAALGIESPLLTWGCHPELVALGGAGGGRPRRRRPRALRRARQLHGQAQAVPGDRRGVHAGERRPPAAADPRPGRPQGGQAREGGRRRRAGRDRARGPARPTSTCASSPPATSASRHRAGRASGCRSTRRSPSACRRSPTTRRR